MSGAPAKDTSKSSPAATAANATHMAVANAALKSNPDQRGPNADGMSAGVPTPKTM